MNRKVVRIDCKMTLRDAEHTKVKQYADAQAKRKSGFGTYYNTTEKRQGELEYTGKGGEVVTMRMLEAYGWACPPVDFTFHGGKHEADLMPRHPDTGKPQPIQVKTQQDWGNEPSWVINTDALEAYRNTTGLVLVLVTHLRGKLFRVEWMVGWDAIEGILKPLRNADKAASQPNARAIYASDLDALWQAQQAAKRVTKRAA